MQYPFYNEVAHTPLFIWDPRSGVKAQRRQSLVQTIDLAPTLLDFFDVPRPESMQGKPLKETIENDVPVREAGLFGIHGGHVNVTDGKYVYMRAAASPGNFPLFQYTHMPAHMHWAFSVEEMRTMECAPPFSFTKDCPVMKISCAPNNWKKSVHEYGTLLFDIESDYAQEHPMNDPEIEAMMVDHLVRGMKANDAPKEQFERLGLKE